MVRISLFRSMSSIIAKRGRTINTYKAKFVIVGKNLWSASTYSKSIGSIPPRITACLIVDSSFASPSQLGYATRVMQGVVEIGYVNRNDAGSILIFDTMQHGEGRAAVVRADLEYRVAVLRANESSEEEIVGKRLRYERSCRHPNAQVRKTHSGNSIVCPTLHACVTISLIARVLLLDNFDLAVCAREARSSSMSKAPRRWFPILSARNFRNRFASRDMLNPHFSLFDLFRFGIGRSVMSRL